MARSRSARSLNSFKGEAPYRRTESQSYGTNKDDVKLYVVPAHQTLPASLLALSTHAKFGNRDPHFASANIVEEATQIPRRTSLRLIVATSRKPLHASRSVRVVAAIEAQSEPWPRSKGLQESLWRREQLIPPSEVGALCRTNNAPGSPRCEQCDDNIRGCSRHLRQQKGNQEKGKDQRRELGFRLNQRLSQTRTRSSLAGPEWHNRALRISTGAFRLLRSSVRSDLAKPSIMLSIRKLRGLCRSVQ